MGRRPSCGYVLRDISKGSALEGETCLPLLSLACLELPRSPSGYGLLTDCCWTFCFPLIGVLQWGETPCNSGPSVQK